MKRICEVYRCSKKEGMYLYVDKQEGLSCLPESLAPHIGKTELAMTLVLTPEKKLAQADAANVLADIERQGFYLQIPKIK